MKKLIFSSLLFFGLIFSVHADIPDFPMAFYGTITVDGTGVPVGSIVRAYYGTTKMGEVIVPAAGVYGYASSSAQKLLVGEGSGIITFSIQSTLLNGGSEIFGVTPVTYSGFISGTTVELPLIFTLPVVTSTQTVSRRSSGGGGGGGSSPVNTLPTIANTTPTPTLPANLARLNLSPELLQALLFVLSVTDNKTTPTNITTAKGTVSSALIPKTSFTLGARSEDVKKLQITLNTLGYAISTGGVGSKGYETTYFGPATKRALIAFQKENGLPATGYFGALTRATMEKLSTPVVNVASQGNSNSNTEPVKSSTISTSFIKTVLKKGDTGEEVKSLQQFLNKNGFIVANSGAGSVGNETSTFTLGTENALIRYQGAMNLKLTGVLDQATKNSMGI